MLRFVGFLTDSVGPDWAQQIVASDLGMYYLLHYNHAIIFLKIVGFLADGVEPDWARRLTWLGMRRFLDPNMEIKLDGYFVGNC